MTVPRSFEAFWPEELGFPPSMPWMGGVTTRNSLIAALRSVGGPSASETPEGGERRALSSSPLEGPFGRDLVLSWWRYELCKNCGICNDDLDDLREELEVKCQEYAVLQGCRTGTLHYIDIWNCEFDCIYTDCWNPETEPGGPIIV